MSTKIYEAYRLKKKSDMWPLVHDLYAKGRLILKKEMRNLYAVASDKLLQEDLAAGKEPPEHGSYLFRAQQVVRDEMKRAEASPYRGDFWNIETTICIREYKGRMVFIPYTENDEIRKLLKNDPRLTEYGYWNNTDEPKGMDLREWNRRKHYYDDMDSAKKWHNYLALEIGSSKSMFEIDPVYEMMDERKKAKEEEAKKLAAPKKGKKARG